MNNTVSKAQHVLSFTVMGTRVVPIAEGADAAQWEMFGLHLSSGGKSPLHTIEADKVFAVTVGTVRLTVGDRVQDVEAGGSVQIPAGTPHNYANVSDAPASMIALVVGRANQIEFLRGMSVLTAAGRPDPAALAEHTARHGVHILPTS